jgi:hypothetical protein
MERVRLTPRQIENILKARDDLDVICNEIAIAQKTGNKVDEEIIKVRDYCKARVEAYMQNYVKTHQELINPKPGEREIINVSK